MEIKDKFFSKNMVDVNYVVQKNDYKFTTSIGCLITILQRQTIIWKILDCFAKHAT